MSYKTQEGKRHLMTIKFTANSERLDAECSDFHRHH
jgi:hypothetical protein